MITYALHLSPKQDLMKTLNAFVQENQLKASYIFTCAGSLTRAVLGLVNQHSEMYEGHFEIVTLVGTLCSGDAHLHLSITDESGRTIAGHVMPGCSVDTEAEIVLSELSGGCATNLMVPQTGYEAPLSAEDNVYGTFSMR